MISQAFIIFAVVRRLFEEVYKYVSDNYIVAVKISTYLIIFVILYFIVGYVLYSTKRIYKYLYKIEDKNITTNDIDDLIITSIDDEIFAITKAVINNDVDASLMLYNEFMKRSYEVTQIIGLLANQFRFLYQVKNLYNNSKYQDEIAKILDVHPYRVKLAINNIYYYTEGDLLKYIDKLAILDRKIKQGDIDKNTGLELFLINKDI